MTKDTKTITAQTITAQDLKNHLLIKFETDFKELIESHQKTLSTLQEGKRFAEKVAELNDKQKSYDLMEQFFDSDYVQEYAQKDLKSFQEVLIFVIENKLLPESKIKKIADYLDFLKLHSQNNVQEKTNLYSLKELQNLTSKGNKANLVNNLNLTRAVKTLNFYNEKSDTLVLKIITSKELTAKTIKEALLTNKNNPKRKAIISALQISLRARLIENPQKVLSLDEDLIKKLSDNKVDIVGFAITEIKNKEILRLHFIPYLEKRVLTFNKKEVSTKEIFALIQSYIVTENVSDLKFFFAHDKDKFVDLMKTNSAKDCVDQIWKSAFETGNEKILKVLKDSFNHFSKDNINFSPEIREKFQGIVKHFNKLEEFSKNDNSSRPGKKPGESPNKPFSSKKMFIDTRLLSASKS